MCEIEISYMGKNNGNPDLVCEKNVLFCDIMILQDCVESLLIRACVQMQHVGKASYLALSRRQPTIVLRQIVA